MLLLIFPHSPSLRVILVSGTRFVKIWLWLHPLTARISESIRAMTGFATPCSNELPIRDIAVIDNELTQLEEKLQELEHAFDVQEEELEAQHLDEVAELTRAYKTQLQILHDKHDAAVTSMHQEIDGQLLPVQETIVQLKQRRNALLPVSRLPQELLAAIFRALQLLLPSNGQGWNVVCSVCQCWRDAALAYSVLWADIGVTVNSNWTAVLLQRSGNAPLNVSVDVSNSMVALHREEGALLVFSHVHRIRSLSIRAFSTAMDRLLLNLDHPAPLIEKLCLSAPPRTMGSMVIPPSLFGGEAPKLKFVEIIGPCSFYAQHPMAFKSITRLTLSCLDMSWSYDWETFTHLLSLPGSLRSLTLQDIVGFKHFLIETSVGLPHLESLSIQSETLYGVLQLLEHIDTPSLVSLHIRGTAAGQYNDNDIRSLFVQIARCASQTETGLRAIDIDMRNNSFIFSGWSALNSAARLNVALGFSPQMFDVEERARILVALVEFVPLTHVDAMVFTSAELTDYIIPWNVVLSATPALRRLNVAILDLFPLLSAMTGVSGIAQELRQLIVRQADFQGRLGSMSHGALLHGELVRRKMIGVPVELLRLRRCLDIEPRDIELLRGLVPNFDWDEHGVRSEDEY
jgi:hypothetical protein